MDQITLEELFPLCNNRTCPQFQRHHHPEPHQLELIHAPEKFIYLQAGYGAGKTLQACVLGLLLSLNIPGNRGIVVRRTYPKLHDSTQRVFMEVLERSGVDYRGRENRDGWYNRIILPNESEIFFRESQTLGRFLGPQYGWFLVDEASEEPQQTFKDLQGRLRLPAAGPYLKGLLLSNPPHHIHWLHDVFGDQPRSWTVEVDIGGGVTERVSFRFMKVKTTDNPHNPEGYVAGLIAGATEHEIARIVGGEYGFTPEGAPAFPEFQLLKHVGLPTLLDHQPLIRSWDFGFRHPAVTFHDFWKCHKGKPHWSWLAEFDGKFIEAKPFADQVLAYSRVAFPGVDPLMVVDCGDQSEAKMTDKGPGAIWELAAHPFNLRFQYIFCHIDPGLRMIRDFLKEPRCECDEERFLIHRRCKFSIEALSGGYHLPKEREGRAPKEQPVKDGFFDDLADSGRYAAENFLRPQLTDSSMLERIRTTERPRRGDPWQKAMQKLMKESRRG